MVCLCATMLYQVSCQKAIYQSFTSLRTFIRVGIWRCLLLNAVLS